MHVPGALGGGRPPTPSLFPRNVPNAFAAAGTGAVMWLKLDDKGGSEELKEVYRVVTAVCKKAEVFSMEYATEY